LFTAFRLGAALSFPWVFSACSQQRATLDEVQLTKRSVLLTERAVDA
jgi:hypothetical protein